MPTTWTVYILECADGSLYTGITTDIERRCQEHGTSRGAKYTRGRGPFKLLYHENLGSRSAAARRELVIKSMSKRQKMKLIG